MRSMDKLVEIRVFKGGSLMVGKKVPIESKTVFGYACSNNVWWASKIQLRNVNDELKCCRRPEVLKKGGFTYTGKIERERERQRRVMQGSIPNPDYPVHPSTAPRCHDPAMLAERRDHNGCPSWNQEPENRTDFGVIKVFRWTAHRSCRSVPWYGSQ